LRKEAKKQGRTTPAQLSHTAVLFSFETFRDPLRAPCGYKVPVLGIDKKVAVYKGTTKRSIENYSQLTPVEKVESMASLTWEDILGMEGEHVEVLLNGTTASNNSVDGFADLKIASAAALGGNHSLDQGIHLASNTSLSTSARASNFSETAPRTRLDMSNTTTSSNASMGDEVQFGHQDITDPPPYDILSLGTAYTLGNIGQGINMLGISNTSSDVDTLNST
jgi:hypothetical protein